MRVLLIVSHAGRRVPLHVVLAVAVHNVPPCVSLTVTCMCALSPQEVTIPVPSLQDKKPDVIPGEERKETVDAAIVRIMKARKRLPHAELVQEVLLQIKFFRPDPRLIKSRIDYLMNTYIKREDPMSVTSPYV